MDDYYNTAIYAEQDRRIAEEDAWAAEQGFYEPLFTIDFICHSFSEEYTKKTWSIRTNSLGITADFTGQEDEYETFPLTLQGANEAWSWCKKRGAKEYSLAFPSWTQFQKQYLPPLDYFEPLSKNPTYKSRNSSQILCT